MSKCNKVKNPCKICLGPVTRKNGLQCQGACESWVHYACLNYTPGRIKDIKAGIIKVTCPCPDCKTSMPKEFRTDEPFSCTNIQCPANKPPQCANMKCPRNVGVEAASQGGGPCPLGTCGKECKQHSSPLCPIPACEPRTTSCDPQAPLPKAMPATSSDICFDPNRCPSGCSGGTTMGDGMSNMGELGAGKLPSISAMEEICNTIGMLSNQMNCLMNKMRDGGGSQPCPKTQAVRGQSAKKKCPKPCFCPGNPANR